MQEKTRSLTQFIIIYFISRFFCLFIPGQVYDFYEDAVWASALLDQQNIYQAFSVASQGTAVLKYPPLYYPLLSLMLLAFGFYSWSIRIGFTLWEVAILFVLYYFTNAVNGNRVKKGDVSKIDPMTVIYVYAFSPVTIYNLIFGQPWFLGVFFSLLGIFAFYQQKPKLTGSIFCIGFLTQLYPGFCLFPIVIFYLSKKRWKNLLELIGTFAIFFVILCLPFFLLDSQQFLFNFFTHLSRIPQTTTLWELFGTSLPVVSFFGSIEISILGAISLLFTGTFLTLTFIKFKKDKSLNEENVIWTAIVYYLFLPILFLTLDFRYCFWAFPFLCIFLNQSCILKQRIRMGITAIGLTSSMGLLFLFLMPELLSINQSVYYGLTTVIAILSLSMIFFLVALPVYIYFWFHLGKSVNIHVSEKYSLNLHQSITLISTIFIFQLGRFSSFWPTFLSTPLVLFIILVSTVVIGLLVLLPRINKIITYRIPSNGSILR